MDKRKLLESDGKIPGPGYPPLLRVKYLALVALFTVNLKV
jgi:hypothetical protein